MRQSGGNRRVAGPADAVISAFRVNNSLVSNVTGDSTVYTVVFDTTGFDLGGDFSSTTFTAPLTGKYLLALVCRIQAVDTNSDVTNVTITTSNDIYNHNLSETDTNHTSQTATIVVVADMDATDTATVTVAVTGGTKVVDIAAGAAHFSGILLS